MSLKEIDILTSDNVTDVSDETDARAYDVASASSVKTALAGKLDKSGGTVTGDVNIESAEPILNVSASRTNYATLYVQNGAHTIRITSGVEDGGLVEPPKIEIDGVPVAITSDVATATKLTPVYSEWTLGDHYGEFLFRNISATYNEDEKGWDTSEEMSQDGGVTWQTATVPASDNPDPDRSATSVTCVSATFNRTIIGYRLGTSATAPILVPVTEKTGEEPGAKTYELPEPIKTTLFTEAAFKQAVADKVSEMYDNAEEVRYPCYENAEITAY